MEEAAHPCQRCFHQFVIAHDPRPTALFTLCLKTSNNTVKVDVKSQKIVVDQVLSDVTLEDLQEEMPSAVPRYIVFAYKHVHKDERVSYQLVFIYYAPPQIKPELAMLYSSSLQRLYSQLEIQKVFDARKPSELNEKWLLDKLSYFGL